MLSRVAARPAVLQGLGNVGAMSPEQYLAALDADGTAFAAAADGNLAAPVTHCPGWSVADLVYHLGGVHRFWGMVVGERLTEIDFDTLVEPARPDDEDLMSWYRDSFIALKAALAEADPSTPVWTWAPQQEVAFVQRRMAQETAVHRWDAQLAAHSPQPIEATIAVDGIDEFLTCMLDGDPDNDDDAGPPIEGSLHLHVTDPDVGGGEWMVRFDGRTPAVSSGHEKGDAALRGPASDLLLALWRRVPPEVLDIVGDRTLASRFLQGSNLE